jgi:hypothetical protein
MFLAQLCTSNVIHTKKYLQNVHMLSLNVTPLKVKHFLHICFRKLVPNINNAFNLKHIPLCWKHKTLKIRRVGGKLPSICSKLFFPPCSIQKHSLQYLYIFPTNHALAFLSPPSYTYIIHAFSYIHHLYTEFAIYLFPQSCNLPLPIC